MNPSARRNSIADSPFSIPFANSAPTKPWRVTTLFCESIRGRAFVVIIRLHNSSRFDGICLQKLELARQRDACKNVSVHLFGKGINYLDRLGLPNCGTLMKPIAFSCILW
jgi:hypothetical protein